MQTQGTPHVVIIGQGAQALRTVLVDAAGVPRVPSLSPTFRILNLRYHQDDPTRVVAEGTATIDSAATTTTATSGPQTPDPKALAMTSASGFQAGRRYLLSSGTSQELVRIVSISGNNARTEHEIRSTYPSGAALSGIEVGATFPAARADADEERYEETRFAWDLNVEGVPGLPFAREFVVLRRREATRRADAEAVLDLDPTIQTVARERHTIAQALRVAYRTVDAKLRSTGRDPALFDGGETQRLTEAYLAIESIYASMVSDSGPGSAYEMKRERAEQRAREHMRDLTYGAAPGDATETERSGDSSEPGPPADFASPFRPG